MRRRRVYFGVLFATLFVLHACDRRGSQDDARRRADGPNVLLITLDTTRADRLGCYGHAAAHTPALDGLAESGVRFERALCQVPLTLPSHASLFTGAYPPTTGLRVNGGGALGDELPTLAESFQTRGYRTGAFISAWVLNAMFGLQRGFEHYDDQLGEGTGPELPKERSGDAVCDAALTWLDEQPGVPFFAWVHFFDPHDPYEPPAPFSTQLADPYDGEIAFVDAQVGRLLEWLETNACRQRTLIVVVGDHGEAFGEHGETTHGLFVYDTTMHVPLIFSFPGRCPAGQIVLAGVRVLDVAPTVLDLMGWEESPQMQGQSLRAALAGDEFAFLPSYGESEYPLVGFGWAPLRSYTTERWKYIAAPRPELYDRRDDPDELTNLVARHAEVAAQLRGELDDLLAGMTRYEATSVALDGPALRSLESLGYVGGGAATDEDEAGEARRDPKDMVAVLRGLELARNLLHDDRCAEAANVLEPLVTQSPESDELHAALSAAYIELGRYAEAEREARASLRTVPSDRHKLCRLGDALYRQNKIAAATDCYQRALATSSDHALAHNRLGVIYTQQNDTVRAYQHLRRYAELKPTSATAWINLANAAARMGRTAEALSLVDKTLDHAPTPREAREAVRLATSCCRLNAADAESFAVLSRAHAAAGDFAGAIKAAERALSLARSGDKGELAGRIEQRLQSYRAGRVE